MEIRRQQPHVLILAAGRSTRMGNVDKLQLPVNGKAILVHVVECALEHFDHVSVVTPPAPLNEALSILLEDYAVDVVENDSFEDGIASSIVAGVNSLDPETDGYMIMLGDMPDISSPTLWALANAFGTNPDRIVIPVHDGAHGHPVIFPARARDELLALSGDRGARSVIRKHVKLVREVPVNDPGTLVDVDRLEDYRKMVLR